MHDLGENLIGSVGMAHLSKAQLPSLKRLGLYCNHLSLNGIQFLIKGNWKNLNHMNMRTR